MQRYIDHAIIWDFLFAVIVGVTLLMLRVPIERTFCLPTDENLEGFGLSLITVSATLLGFLLTIITVIVTFKKGFEESPRLAQLLSPKPSCHLKMFSTKK